MSTDRKYYVSAAVLLLFAWLAVLLFAPEGSLWDALTAPLAAAGIVVLIPALFGPMDEPLKRWHRG